MEEQEEEKKRSRGISPAAFCEIIKRMCMWHQSVGCQASCTYTASYIKDSRLRLHHGNSMGPALGLTGSDAAMAT